MRRLIDRLPEHSHYQRALADDDELQRQFGSAGPRKPTLRAWSAERELRATLYDVASLIQVAIVSVNTPKGKQAPRFKPVRRPETAADRDERRRLLDMHRHNVRKLLPGRDS